MRFPPALAIASSPIRPDSSYRRGPRASDGRVNRRSRRLTPDKPAENKDIDGELRAAGERLPRILWVDDELDLDDALVRLLALEGFRIEIAGTGAAGLSKARTRSYDGIVLDLRLPDIFGLTVLKRLVDQSGAPVLVVTGYYHEPEMEGEAIKAGAAAFRHKPLIDIEDLASVLDAMVAHASWPPRVIRPSVSAASQAPELEASDLPSLTRTSSRQEQILMLSRQLAQRDVRSLEFIVTARTLRRMIKDRRWVVQPTAGNPTLADEVRTLLGHLELKLDHGLFPREMEIETELGLKHGNFGRLLKLHTGFGFREWRRALRLRPALPAVGFTNEHIRQIAFRFGYEHASQFDRDFYQTLGLTPRQYRRLLSMGSIT